MRIYPRKSDFRSILTLLRLPKKIILLITQVSLGVWDLITKKTQGTKPLTKKQVIFLKKIKQNKHKYKIILNKDIPKHDEIKLVIEQKQTPLNEVKQPQYGGPILEPMYEEVRMAVRALASELVTALYEDKLKKGVISYQKKNFIRLLEKLVVKASDPFLSTLKALVQKYKGENADAEQAHQAIKNLISYLDENFQKKLSIIIEKAITLNTTKFVDILACRVLNLISHINIGEKVDEFGLAACAHVSGLAEADQLVSGLIQRTEKPDAKKDTKEQKILLAQNREEIRQKGIQTYYSEKLLQAFLDKKVCHERIKDLAQMEIDESKEALHEIFSDFSNELIDLLLPKCAIKKKDRSLEPIGGFGYLWHQIEWPPEFYEIKNSVSEIFTAHSA
jgi:hypothetical protein